MKPRAVMNRKVWSTDPTHIRRRERYRHLIESDVPRPESVDASQHPVRYVAALAARGVEPIPELAIVRQGGRPRVDTPKARDCKRRYHELRSHGKDARFCSEYSKSPQMFAKALRIIFDGESE